LKSQYLAPITGGMSSQILLSLKKQRLLHEVVAAFRDIIYSFTISGYIGRAASFQIKKVE
jgi:hypothetical protein